MATYDDEKNYPHDTLGFHYAMCRALFGLESDATKFIERKADESPNGYDERVIADEGQIVNLLGTMHFAWMEKKHY